MEVWLLTSMLELHLYDNQFTGTITTEIGMMKSLTSLALQNNDLTSTLPNQLNASMALRLHGNQFSGTVASLFFSMVFYGVIAPSMQLPLSPPVLTSKQLHLIRLGGFQPQVLMSCSICKQMIIQWAHHGFGRRKAM
ncbi:expressed unknown protein [Seminavis robusta]|uniref:Uncharacterized protein n=1 Tax=Seminavis robusta TaxID=568900 RepID=A0A9N8HVI4_9STRA|nr:expressed unknown protein [Seminavis robusta]|eukprot:Sro1811_g299181.1  (137) ;mRNA; r:8543-8953